MSYSLHMSNETIIALIDSEISRLTQVRALLSTVGKIDGRIAKSKPGPAKGKRRKKRVLSAEARKKIADAQRRRWAAQKSKAKKAA